MGWESEEGLWERTSYYIKSYTFWCSSSIAALGFEGNCDFFFFFLRNDMSTTFLKQILSGRLLLVVSWGKKVILVLGSNLN